jgi:hypothetical protein
LLQDGDDLAVGKARRLHVELSFLSRKFYFQTRSFCGGITLVDMPESRYSQ